MRLYMYGQTLGNARKIMPENLSALMGLPHIQRRGDMGGWEGTFPLWDHPPPSLGKPHAWALWIYSDMVTSERIRTKGFFKLARWCAEPVRL